MVDLVSDYFICEVLVVFLQQSNLAQQPVMEWHTHITSDGFVWHGTIPSKLLSQVWDRKCQFIESSDVFEVIVGYGNAHVFQAEFEQLLD